MALINSTLNNGKGVLFTPTFPLFWHPSTGLTGALEIFLDKQRVTFQWVSKFELLQRFIKTMMVRWRSKWVCVETTTSCTGKEDRLEMRPRHYYDVLLPFRLPLLFLWDHCLDFINFLNVHLILTLKVAKARPTYLFDKFQRPVEKWNFERGALFSLNKNNQWGYGYHHDAPVMTRRITQRLSSNQAVVKISMTLLATRPSAAK